MLKNQVQEKDKIIEHLEVRSVLFNDVEKLFRESFSDFYFSFCPVVALARS